MSLLLDFLARAFTRPPWDYLSWPALAMIGGTLIGMVSTRLAGRMALVPRQLSGLVGLVTAPFIHANLAHLAANLPPFLVLGVLLVQRDEAGFLTIAVTLALVQGTLLWFFGRKAAHVGMSGVIFGLFGYLLAVAWYTQATSDLLTAGLVILFYGGMLAGIAPTRNGTSWDGHLFGLVAGFASAWFHYRR